MQVFANIESVNYKPFLCRELPEVSWKDFETGIAFKNASFVMKIDEGKIGVSHWVSAKRTRSYPFARVYETMKYLTRVTIIPLVKDEGIGGDRDYLQWDTVSLMSLLGVKVIIAYYTKAKKSKNYPNKITDQEFDYQYLVQKFKELLDHKSNALDWNLRQLAEIDQIAEKCSQAYQKIEKKCKVKLNSIKGLRTRINKITSDAKHFKEFSRQLAKKAQHRESLTKQPKERTIDEKGKITIKNHLGGEYYFTADEITIRKNKVFLIEKKHSCDTLPSLADIQDGLIKMILYTNIKEVYVNGKEHRLEPILGLTADKFEGICRNQSDLNSMKNQFSKSEFNRISILFEEAFTNGFTVFLMDAANERLQEELLNEL